MTAYFFRLPAKTDSSCLAFVRAQPGVALSANFDQRIADIPIRARPMIRF